MSKPTQCFVSVILTGTGLSTLSQREQLMQLGRIANDLSLPFCQLEIQHLLMPESGASAQCDHQTELAASLFEITIHAGESDHLVWLELVSSLDAAMLFMVSHTVLCPPKCKI